MKQRKCVICKSWFTPFSTTQKCCTYPCAMKKVVQDREKADRKEYRVKKEALKTLSDHLKDTQAVVNAYIRERDKDLPCISCNRHHKGQYQAGHYRSIGAAPQLRFNEDNINKQCTACNNHKSGNAVEYRINLVKKIGQKRVEALENNNTPALFTIEDAKRIKAVYREKLKALVKNMGE